MRVLMDAGPGRGFDATSSSAAQMRRSMKCAIDEGTVSFHRPHPREHQFPYRVFALLLDLGEPDWFTRNSWLLGRNRAAPLRFHDSDHGDRGELYQWLDRLLAQGGISAGGAKRVLCYPRLFGFVFKPLSTWFCNGEDGTLAAIVYEVHHPSANIMPMWFQQLRGTV
jgi:DUF1365 family protein